MTMTKKARKPLGEVIKRIGRDLLPPVAIRMARRFRQPPPAPVYGFFGDYPTYKAALEACKGEGYESEALINRVEERTRQALLQTRLDPALRMLDERSLQNLAALLLVLSGKRSISILDFGGALGLHYQQLSQYLGGPLSWTVCETRLMAEHGARNFVADGLQFVSSLDDVEGQTFDVVFASGSLSYLEDPARTLKKLASLSDRLVLNRMPFVGLERDCLTVQRVDPVIHAGSMPSWFFSEQKWLSHLEELGFEILMRWQVQQDVMHFRGGAVVYQGLAGRRST